MFFGKGAHPFGQPYVDADDGKFEQRFTEQRADVVLVHFFGVERDGGRSVFLFERLRELYRRGRIRLFAVYDDDERLFLLFDFFYRAFFRFFVIFARNFRYAAVGGNEHGDCGMIFNHFFGAELCRGGKFERVFRPRRFDKSRFAVLFEAVRPLYGKADAIHEPDFCRYALFQGDFGGLGGNEFRFRGHDGFSRAGLRQFVHHDFFAALGGIRDDKAFHKPLDKSGFARADGTDHPYVNTAAGAA